MGVFLPNTTSPDAYPSSPQLGGLSTPYERGQILIANNPVVLTVYRGPDRGSIAEDEYSYVTPSLIPLVRGQKEFIYGVKFRNAIAGSPSQVSGYLIEPGVAGLGAGSAFTQSVTAGGGVTPGVSSVQVQHNGVLIGTEPILDLIDTSDFSWGLVDDTVNTRVTVTPPTSIPFWDKPTLNGVVNSAAETDLIGAAGLGYLLPAGVMFGNSGVCRITLGAVYLNNTGVNQNFRLRLYFGGTLMFDSGAQAVITTAQVKVYRWVWEIQNQGATNSQWLIGAGGTSSTASVTGVGQPVAVQARTSTSDGEDQFGSLAAAAINTQNAVRIRATMTLGVADPNLSVTPKVGLVEAIA